MDWNLIPCPFCGTGTLDMHQNRVRREGVDGWDVFIACGHIACRTSGPHRWIEATASVDEVDKLACNAWNARVLLKGASR